MSLPTDSAERKRIPMYTGLRVYFPDALAAVAAHSFISNEKHNPGEPCHWSREKSNDHLDCIDRHLTDIAARPEDLDLRVFELKAVVWRALAQLQLDIEAQQTRDAAERAGIVQTTRPGAPVDLSKGPWTKGSFDVVSTPAVTEHYIGESGACNCSACAAMAEGWIEWGGGECPVTRGTRLEVRFRNGDKREINNPESFRWTQVGSLNPSVDIVAYRRRR